MNITIIGAGHVGEALGTAFTSKGHTVYYGVPDPKKEKYRHLPELQVLTPAEATKRSDIIILATPWKAAQEAIRACGDLKKKILVDCINPINPYFTGLEIGHTTSCGEQVANWAPDAIVVKCFNTTGAHNISNPNYGSQKLAMFAASNHPEALDIVANLSTQIGFDTIKLPFLELSRQLEQLAWLWIELSINALKTPDIGFTLAHRK
jgi:predicted dinucleotide-binding enzyme